MCTQLIIGPIISDHQSHDPYPRSKEFSSGLLLLLVCHIMFDCQTAVHT